jgi:hypothetical protein
MANSSAQQSDFGIKRPVPIVLKKAGERGMPAGWYAYGLTVDDVEVPAQVLPAYGGPFGSKNEVEQAIAAHWGAKPKRNPPARRRKKNPAWLVPVAVVGGAIVLTTAISLAIRRYRKVNALEPGTPDEPIVEPPSGKLPLVRLNVALEGTSPFLDNKFKLAAPSASVVDMGNGSTIVVKAPVDVVVSFPDGPNEPTGLEVWPGAELLEGAVESGSRDYLLRFLGPTPADSLPVMFTVSKPGEGGEGEYQGGWDYLRISAV